MGALRLISIEEGIKIGINSRVGQLLKTERESQKLKPDEVSRRFGLKAETLLQWESGEESPPACIYIKVVEFYGPEAYRRAAELDLEMQFEKYNRAVATQKVDFAQFDRLRGVNGRYINDLKVDGWKCAA